MGDFFGTDGIRGSVNQYPIVREVFIKIGNIIAKYFINKNKNSKIIIGRDSRSSGLMIENAISRGICSAGVSVVRVGVIPTSGISLIVAKKKFIAGIIISASHNPFYDNGIKLFNNIGFKLNSSLEMTLEYMMKKLKLNSNFETISDASEVFFNFNLTKIYINFIKYSYLNFLSIKKMKIIIDASNGSLSSYAFQIFKSLNLNLITIFSSPNGININDICGSEFSEFLKKFVLCSKVELGLAFDGDGDRIISVLKSGKILTGNHFLSIFANSLKNKNCLKNNAIVSNIMSNFGLNIALQKMRINYLQTNKVGDSSIINIMLKNNFILGGENSGHIIVMNSHIVGDSVLSAIFLLIIVEQSGRSLLKSLKNINWSLQFSKNVNVNLKPQLSALSEVNKAIILAKEKLGVSGRIIIRYSGTQPKCRVMIEGKNLNNVKRQCRNISMIISKYLK